MTMLAKTTERAPGLADYEARIRIYREQAVSGFLGIGRTLNEAKAAGVVPHGEWEAWVERTTGMAIRQAQRCMQAAQEIAPGSALERLDMSKAILLLSSGLDAEQKETLAGKAAEDGASVRELKEQIRKLKMEKVQEAGAAAEIRTALKQAESERDQLKGQMAAAVQAVREDAERQATEAYERGTKDQSRMNTAALRAANNAIDRYEKQNRELQQQLKDAEEANQDQYNMGKDAIDRYEKRNRELQEQLKAAEEANQDQYNLGKDAGDQERRKLRGQVEDLLEERCRLQAALKDARESSGAEDMAKQIRALQAEAEKQAAEAYARGKERGAERAGELETRLKDMQRELEAAEEREAKKARELAELKKERAKAGMDAARGIRADAMNGLDLAAAVRAFIGQAGTLPQMGAAIAGMNERERDGIRAQVETVAEWVRASRAALGTVVAEASIM